MADHSIAERMKTARKLAGLTQDEAADKLGVASRTYIRWEHGETKGNLARLDDVARVFETTPAELLGDDSAVVLVQMAAQVDRLAGMIAEIHSSVVTKKRTAKRTAKS